MNALSALAALLLAVPLLAGGAAAQDPAVRWDSLGPAEAAALAILPGPEPDGSRDVLFVAGRVTDSTTNSGSRLALVRRHPGEAAWREDVCIVGICLPQDLLVTASGALLASARTGPTDIDRSEDGGVTWQREVAGDGVKSECLYQSALPALGGAVYACGDADPADPDGPNALNRVWRSLGDGRAGTWEPLGAIGPPGGPRADYASFIEAFAEAPESAALPEGRLLVGVANGVALSADGGATWAPSALWRPFHWWVRELAVVPDPAHPYGGTVLAALGDFVRGVSGVWASEDGGQTWEERALWRGLGAGDESALAVGPDGAVYAATNDIAPDPNLGTVYRSRDGGRTWEGIAGPTWGGYGTAELHLGRDGRLYAATVAGVWRTAGALPVSRESAPEASGAPLRVSPNPSSGAVRIALSVGTLEAATVTVYDGRGRAVWASGARGGRAWEVDTSAWAAGVYVVRAEGGGESVSARFTVAR